LRIFLNPHLFNATAEGFSLQLGNGPCGQKARIIGYQARTKLVKF